MAESTQIGILDANNVYRNVSTISRVIETVGLSTDAKATQTDSTSVTHTSILKQISASAQALETKVVSGIQDVQGTIIVSQIASTVNIANHGITGIVNVANHGILGIVNISGTIAVSQVGGISNTVNVTIVGGANLSVSNVQVSVNSSNVGILGVANVYGNVNVLNLVNVNVTAIATNVTVQGSISALSLGGISNTVNVNIVGGANLSVGNVSVSTGGTANATGFFKMASNVIIRPATTTTYAADEQISDSTSSPSANGYLLKDVVRQVNGSGIITDVVVTTTAKQSTPLQGEVLFFTGPPTNAIDNGGLTVTDGQIQADYCGSAVFTLSSNVTTGYVAHVTGLNMGFTANNSANIWFLLKTLNAYAPASQEQIMVKVKVMQVT